MTSRFFDLFQTYKNAWIAGGLIALSCSVVAVYVVLRRVAFIGIATAQVAAAGVALALLLHFAPLPAAAAATLLGVLLFAMFREPVRVTREALVGVAFALASALSVLFVHRSSTELDHIEHVIYGSLLFTAPSQVWILAAGGVVVLALHALFAKEFLMVSFDPDTARTLGVKTRTFDLLLFGSIGAVIALSIGTAGSLLTFALLVLPPLTALLVADRLPVVFLLSAVAGVTAVAAGFSIAQLFDWPPSPSIVVAASGLLLAAGAARLRPALGAIVIALLLAAVAFFAHARAAAAGGAAPAATVSAADQLHVDVDLAAHAAKVKRGATLGVDWASRVRGSAPRELDLVLSLGSAVAIARIEPGPRAGRVGVDTAELAPGKYRLTGSVWTGSPLEAADATILTNDEAAVNELEVEVTP